MQADILFYFDGQRIQAQNTPAEFDMDEGDVIEVLLQQVGD